MCVCVCALLFTKLKLYTTSKNTKWRFSYDLKTIWFLLSAHLYYTQFCLINVYLYICMWGGGIQTNRYEQTKMYFRTNEVDTEKLFAFPKSECYFLMESFLKGWRNDVPSKLNSRINIWNNIYVSWLEVIHFWSGWELFCNPYPMCQIYKKKNFTILTKI